MSESKNSTQSEVWSFRSVLVVGIAVGLVGCASMERSVVLGVGTGAAMGTGVGLAMGGRHKTEATLISAGVGALVGGFSAYLIHGQLDKRDDGVRRNTLFNLENHGITRLNSGRVDLSDVGGLLTSPEVEENWVETHTDGPKLIEGHREWTLLGSSQWNLSRKPDRRKRK